jgi:regulatory protein
MLRRTSLSPEQALQKARHYCGYQERCHSEVQEKLYSFGLRKPQVEAALATLIEENYLNEERFAIQYAGGHFRLKQWGRVLIRYQLRQKRVSDYCIKKALAAIDEEEYERTLERLAEQKWEKLSGAAGTGGTPATPGTEDMDDVDDADETVAAGGDPFLARRRRLQGYLLRKGFEADRVAAVLPTK